VGSLCSTVLCLYEHNFWVGWFKATVSIEIKAQEFKNEKNNKLFLHLFLSDSLDTFIIGSGVNARLYSTVN